MRRIGLLVSVVALLLCTPCSGQERGKVAYTNEELLILCEIAAKQSEKRSFGSVGPDVYPEPGFFSPPTFANFMSAVYEVVIDGEFFGLPTRAGLDPESLNPRKEVIRFEVAEVYKGQVPDTIHVEVVSDVLAFPGEDHSRYWKRQQVIERASGLGTEQGYDTSWPSDSVRDMYQAGIAIKEQEPYLIGAEPIPGRHNLYRILGEGLNLTFFWGEMRQDIIKAFHAPEAFDKPTPFGSYDPNNEEHCSLLRDLVGAVPESTPRLAAEHLLDSYHLVAQVELQEVPEFTPEMLNWLYNEEIGVRFRVLKRFKGDTADIAEMRLNSDMLSDAGETTSRYVKRREIRKDYHDYFVSYDQRMRTLKEALQAGALDPQSFDDRTVAEFGAMMRHNERLGEPDMMIDREISSWLGDTFYERGGVIQPFTSYLIGVNKALGGEDVYLLGELPESPSRIYWGAEGEEILRELDVLTR